YQNRFTGLQLGVIEQHVLDGGKSDRCASGVARADAPRNWYDEPGRQIEQITGKSVDVESHDSTDVFAKIVAPLGAGGACAAGERAIHDNRVATPKGGHAGANPGDLACRLDPDDHRKLAFGECHAAVAPEVEMVERDCLDANLHF